MTALTIEQQKQILKPYAAGSDLRTISKDTGISHDDVSGLVSSLAFQRTRAAERLRQIEAGAVVVKSAPQATFTPAAPTPAPTVRADVAPVRDRADAIIVLADAEAAGGRFATTAARIRRQVEQLADELARNAEVIAADRRIERLRRELAEATEKARLLRGGKPAVAKSDGDPKAIRQWAAEQGMACKPNGQIPVAVRAAYDERGAA